MKFPKPTKASRPKRAQRRTSQMNRTNAGRRRWLHEIQFGGGIDHDAWVRGKGCMLAGHLFPGDEHRCSGSIQAAHLTSRGAGGKWWDIVGLCDAGHREQESGRLHPVVIPWLRSRARTMVERHLRSIGAI